MEPAVLGTMIPIVALIGAFIMVVYLRRFENAERMAMIEKGVNPEIFASVKRPGNSSFALRASLLLIFAGIGILMGYFLDYYFNMNKVGYFSMLFIFGGIGLGLAYLVEEKKASREKI